MTRVSRQRSGCWIGVLGLAAVICALGPADSTASGDPGVLLEIDRATFMLSARDRASGASHPPIRVVIGSPAHPTPAGEYPLGRVILSPSWSPGGDALAAGARRRAAGLSTPMGVAKIPFAQDGSIAVHGGGDPLLLGKPVSGGCVRTSDADLLRLIGWLHGQRALSPARTTERGELERSFQRRTRLRIR